MSEIVKDGSHEFRIFKTITGDYAIWPPIGYRYRARQKNRFYHHEAASDHAGAVALCSISLIEQCPTNCTCKQE